MRLQMWIHAYTLIIREDRERSDAGQLVKFAIESETHSVLGFADAVRLLHTFGQMLAWYMNSEKAYFVRLMRHADWQIDAYTGPNRQDRYGNATI